MLGGMPTDEQPIPENDNALLVPIGGAQPDIAFALMSNLDPLPANVTGNIDANSTSKPMAPSEDTEATISDNTPNENPLPGSILRVPIKIDMDASGTGDAKPKSVSTKKELTIKQYKLKWKYKPDHKFKCGLCPAELKTVQEFNQHYLDNHLPLPCPDCTSVFTSPCTLAKHRYTHAEYMYECQDCGQGFIFKSQLDSHRKVHLKIAGYVCFKPKCGH